MQCRRRAGQVDGREHVVVQVGKAAFQQHGEAGVGESHKHAAEQIAIRDLERRRAPTTIIADEPHRGRRLEQPIEQQADPEREAERDHQRRSPSSHTYARMPRRTCASFCSTIGGTSCWRVSWAIGLRFVLCQSIQSPDDPFDEQRAGDHAQQPVSFALWRTPCRARL